MSEAKPYTVVYALARPRPPNQTHVDYASSACDACYHHIAYVTALHVDEAIDRCRQDALPGFVFRLVATFGGHADRRVLGDGVALHDFDFADQRDALGKTREVP